MLTVFLSLSFAFRSSLWCESRARRIMSPDMNHLVFLFLELYQDLRMWEAILTLEAKADRILKIFQFLHLIHQALFFGRDGSLLRKNSLGSKYLFLGRLRSRRHRLSHWVLSQDRRKAALLFFFLNHQYITVLRGLCKMPPFWRDHLELASLAWISGPHSL